MYCCLSRLDNVVRRFALIAVCSQLLIFAVSGQVCTAPDTVGSLDHDGLIITAVRTYILTAYTVQCEGIVTTWEFCYQLTGSPSVTFNPGIWVRTGGSGGNSDYSLIQSNTVTFNPNSTSAFSCQNYTLPVTEQFTAPSESVVGLYSNNHVQLLHTTLGSGNAITYAFDGNQSRVTMAGKNHDADFNIAIRAHIAMTTTLSTIMSTILTSVMSTASTLVMATTSTPVMVTTSTLVMATTSTPVMVNTSTPVMATTSTPVMATTSTPVMATTSTPVMATTSTPVMVNTSTPGGESNSSSSTGLIIGIAVLSTLPLTVTLILLIVVVLYCRNKSATYSTTRGSIATSTKAVTGEVTINPNPAYDVTDQSNRNTLNMSDDLEYEVVVVDPSCGTTPEIKKTKRDHSYGFVVSTEEMIKTDANPSYVPISVGDNVLDDNPSYHTV